MEQRQKSVRALQLPFLAAKAWDREEVHSMVLFLTGSLREQSYGDQYANMRYARRQKVKWQKAYRPGVAISKNTNTLNLQNINS